MALRSTPSGLRSAGRTSATPLVLERCGHVGRSCGVGHHDLGRRVGAAGEGRVHQLLPLHRLHVVAEAVTGRELVVVSEVAEGHDQEDHSGADPHPPRVPAQPLGQPAPASVSGVVARVAHVRNARPEHAARRDHEGGRQQREHGRHRHRDPERADRAQAGGAVQLCHGQGQKRGDHGHARREDRRAGAAERARHRVGAALVHAQLLPVAGHEQQGVVRARPEHEHREDRRGLAVHGHPASVSTHPRPRVAISAKATASSGNHSRIGLR